MYNQCKDCLILRNRIILVQKSILNFHLRIKHIHIPQHKVFVPWSICLKKLSKIPSRVSKLRNSFFNLSIISSWHLMPRPFPRRKWKIFARQAHLRNKDRFTKRNATKKICLKHGMSHFPKLIFPFFLKTANKIVVLNQILESNKQFLWMK